MANILVTDDSSFLRRRTCGILKAAGHSITEATDGIECMQQIKDNKPDLVFLDLVMPKMDGIAVLKALNEQDNPTPVIVLTADIQDTVRNECLALGAVDFINKPPREEIIFQILDTLFNDQGTR